jgi:hypothetical protein
MRLIRRAGNKTMKSDTLASAGVLSPLIGASIRPSDLLRVRILQ